jgi:hypothetical protein
MPNKRNTLKAIDVLAIDRQATHSNPEKGHILEIGWVKTNASTGVDIEKISKDTDYQIRQIKLNSLIFTV